MDIEQVQQNLNEKRKDWEADNGYDGSNLSIEQQSQEFFNEFFNRFNLDAVTDEEYVSPEKKVSDGNRRDKILDTMGSPRRWTLENFERKYWPVGYDATCEYIRRCVDGERINLILQKETGSGKSWLACAAALEIAEKKGADRVCFVVDTQLQVMWRNQYSYREDYKKLIIKMKTATILVYDEIGKNQLSLDESGECLTDFGNVVWDILNHRHNSELLTIVTTQLTDMARLTKIIGESTYRRALRSEGNRKKSISVVGDKVSGTR